MLGKTGELNPYIARGKINLSRELIYLKYNIKLYSCILKCVIKYHLIFKY